MFEILFIIFIVLSTKYEESYYQLYSSEFEIESFLMEIRTKVRGDKGTESPTFDSPVNLETKFRCHSNYKEKRKYSK